MSVFSSPARGGGRIVGRNGRRYVRGTLRDPIRAETVGLERPRSRRRGVYGRMLPKDFQHDIRSKTPCSTVKGRIVKEEVKGEVRRKDNVETGWWFENEWPATPKPEWSPRARPHQRPGSFHSKEHNAILLHGAARNTTRLAGRRFACSIWQRAVPETRSIARVFWSRISRKYHPTDMDACPPYAWLQQRPVSPRARTNTVCCAACLATPSSQHDAGVLYSALLLCTALCCCAA